MLFDQYCLDGDGSEYLETTEMDTQARMDDFELFAYGAPDESLEDELTKYERAPIVSVRDNKNFDRIDWWKANRHVYPVLVSMAFNILAIPCMSAELERVFSRYSTELNFAKSL